MSSPPIKPDVRMSKNEVETILRGLGEAIAKLRDGNRIKEELEQHHQKMKLAIRSLMEEREEMIMKNVALEEALIANADTQPRTEEKKVKSSHKKKWMANTKNVISGSKPNTTASLSRSSIANTERHQILKQVLRQGYLEDEVEDPLEAVSIFLAPNNRTESEQAIETAMGCVPPPDKETGYTRYLRLLDSLPAHLVAVPQNLDVLVTIDGPSEHEAMEFYNDNVAAWGTSTYPMRTDGNRDGDPICDSYYGKVLEEHSIFAVADGCNWGFKVREAAKIASREFVEYIYNSIDQIKDTREAGGVILKALNRAHKQIIGDANPIFSNAGTTTIIGGVSLKLKKSADDASSVYAFVTASVGDCKGFLYKREQNVFVELTMGNRASLADPTDCGGRLGPYIQGGPDLRNLHLSSILLQEGDIVLFCSDGVHDNLDPAMLGIAPSDVGVDEAKSWLEAEKTVPGKASRAKSTFMTDLLQRVVKAFMTRKTGDQNITAVNIVKALISHSIAITSSSRDFMESNPGLRQPTDLNLYPGKMDHTTAFAATIGRTSKRPFDNLYDISKNNLGWKEFENFVWNMMNEERKKQEPNIPLEYFNSDKNLKRDLDFIASLAKLQVEANAHSIPSKCVEIYEKYIGKHKGDSSSISSDPAIDSLVSMLFIDAFQPVEQDVSQRLRSIWDSFEKSEFMRRKCFEL